MSLVERIDESNKKRVIDQIRLDVIRHVFAFYDIQYDPEHTTMYAVFRNEKLKGYILIYSALRYPSVILECASRDAERLIKYAPEDNFIVHTSPNLLPIIESRFFSAKHYLENWMLIKKNKANFFRSEFVRRMHGEDSSKLEALLSNREDRSTVLMRRYKELIDKMPLYGVFINGELVSCAGSFIQLPQVWMIGGVYTNPDHRSKGYATLATSAITEEASKNAESAALFVRSDNYPAIRIYEKVGYEKIGEKLWVDVGTGQKP
jgi:RimJ/RimL family protein N-acetyltransferase